MSLGRLRLQCRRGMKELDVLLLGYLEQHYPTAGAAEQACFDALLALPDPVLWDSLCGRAGVSADCQALLVKLQNLRKPHP